MGRAADRTETGTGEDGGQRQPAAPMPHEGVGSLVQLARQAGAAHEVFRCLQQIAMMIGDLQEALKVLVRLGPVPDRQEVDDLDEQPRVAAALSAHGAYDLLQPRQEAVVTDPQQRHARDVADGRFHHDRTRPPTRETPIPLDQVGRDHTFLRCAPRHHRRHLRPLLQRQRPDLNGAEQPRPQRLLARRHGADARLVPYRFGRGPHTPALHQKQPH